MEVLKENENMFVEDYIKLAEIEYSKEQLLKAIEILKTAESKLILEECQFQNSNEHIQNDKYSYFINIPFVKSIFKDNDFIYNCLNNYKIMNKRAPDRSHNGIDTWFIKEDNVSSITISGRVTIACSFFQMVAVFKEVDLLSQAISSYEEVSLVKQISHTRWLAKTKIKMPLTLSNREVYLLGYGIFLKSENMIMLPIYSPKDDEFDEIKEENSNYTRVYMNFGYYCVKYLDETHCELFSCFNMDPKVSMIPWFILNGVTKEFGYYMMNDFRKAAENEQLAVIYKERINENKEFYDLIREALVISN